MSIKLDAQAEKILQAIRHMQSVGGNLHELKKEMVNELQQLLEELLKRKEKAP